MFVGRRFAPLAKNRQNMLQVEAYQRMENFPEGKLIAARLTPSAHVTALPHVNLSRAADHIHCLPRATALTPTYTTYYPYCWLS